MRLRKQAWLVVSALVAIGLVAACTQGIRSTTLFENISADQTNIKFKNELEESEDFNIIEYLYFYNGGGVAIGDINNDGFVDIYFSGNQVANRLFLNKGDFVFQDITLEAGVQAGGNWKTGVAMADVNADGFLDIFVCGVGGYKNFEGYNQLFINNGDLTFSESAKEVGLAFQGFSTQACFFDFDLDGDLDMYLLNHSVHSQRSYGKVVLRFEVDSLAGDILYRNELAETGELRFTDVSERAGILQSHIGYGLGIGVSDVNRDGFPDIYVANDFAENDYLYINQRDGTFKQESERATGHNSRFSMGVDVADVNNDLWPDLMTLDMLPRDEAVIKTSAGEDSYEIYSFKLKYGYHKQVSRNTLQINQGLIDSGRVYFQDIAAAIDVAATDWSWSPSLVDFDGDGLKDIFVSNGIVRRPNDLDYISFISSDSVQKKVNTLEWIKRMPEGKISNFLFKNEDGLSFSDQTQAWGLETPSYSNGVAIGDLDNDGDPDLVINRLNDDALVYRNNAEADRFVKVKLDGKLLRWNTNAIGAKAIFKQGDKQQVQELYPARGWCSSSDYSLMFGRFDPNRPYQLQVVWPDGSANIVESNDLMVTVTYDEPSIDGIPAKVKPRPILQSVNAINFVHQENDFNAFGKESLIPFMLSAEGPALAKGDINGDGLDDVYIGGGKNQPGCLFIQGSNGTFSKKFLNGPEKLNIREEVDAVFFDADNDGDLDLVSVSGGQEIVVASSDIQPALFLNDGSGIFTYWENAFSGIYLQASCVRPCDYDLDGDVDLFVGASVMPSLYGMSPVSFLLVNDGAGNFYPRVNWLGDTRFDNPSITRPGMVKDALWRNINDDNLPDLVLVGEWMPITVLLQSNDRSFRNATEQYGLSKTRGLWNSIATDDIDGDGDIDLIGGNFGWNSRLKASIDKPLTMYLGDFDSNGGSDHILVYFNGDKSYPFPSRDHLVKHIPSLKKKFLNYYDYRDVNLNDIVTPQQQGNSAVLVVDDLSSMVFRNVGDKFVSEKLPLSCQLFPVYDILVEDVDGDGANELLMVGNTSLTQPDIGPQDAGYGLILKYFASGYAVLSAEQSGFFVKGESRNIRSVRTSNGTVIVVAQNNSSVGSFKY